MSSYWFRNHSELFDVPYPANQYVTSHELFLSFLTANSRVDCQNFPREKVIGIKYDLLTMNKL